MLWNSAECKRLRYLPASHSTGLSPRWSSLVSYERALHVAHFDVPLIWLGPPLPGELNIAGVNVIVWMK